MDKGHLKKGAEKGSMKFARGIRAVFCKFHINPTIIYYYYYLVSIMIFSYFSQIQVQNPGQVAKNIELPHPQFQSHHQINYKKK